MEQSAISPDILACAIDRWTGVWGDPLLRGTVTMLVYGLGGLLLLRVARRTGRGDRQLWRICAVFFFALMVNTHLDLHALPTAFGHCIAHAQGWYDRRGPVKLVAFGLIAAVTLLVLVAATVFWWRSIRANVLLVAGVGLTLGFTLIRGADVNEVETLYQVRIGAFRWADLIDYVGVLLAAVAALIRLRRARPIRPARR